MPIKIKSAQCSSLLEIRSGISLCDTTMAWQFPFVCFSRTLRNPPPLFRQCQGENALVIRGARTSSLLARGLHGTGPCSHGSTTLYRLAKSRSNRYFCAQSVVRSEEPQNTLATSGGENTRAAVKSITAKPVGQNEREAESPLPSYKLPTHGILARLPSSWVPYAELARIDKPTGIYYLFFPCVFSTFFSSMFFSTTALPSPSTLLTTNALLLVGSVLFRSAACSWNDTLDRDLDAKVSRTRLRPLVRGAVTPTQAHVFTASQVVLGAALAATCFPFPSFVLYAAPSVVLITLYPLMKRVTYYPQIILGFAWSWGIVMGFPAMGIDLFSGPSGALVAASTFYAANLMWMILGDTIYAFQDLKDDIKVGVKSLPVAIVISQGRVKWIFAGLAAVQVSLLAATGVLAGAGPIYGIGTVAGTAVSLGMMIWKVQLGVPQNCWWWFKWGAWFTGTTIASGIIGEWFYRWRKQNRTPTE